MPPHDDVIKWKHFPCYWPFVRGIHRSPVSPLPKASDAVFSLICAWTEGWVNNRDAGDLRRHCAHHDITVMIWCALEISRSFFLWRVHEGHPGMVSFGSANSDRSCCAVHTLVLYITAIYRESIVINWLSVQSFVEAYTVFFCHGIFKKLCSNCISQMS